MPRSPRSLLARLVRRLPSDPDFPSDADLLARFVRDRDHAAFELLVWRHGGLVLGACRRILGDEHLAEDAFQAAFLVLARKAGTVHGRNVAGWLHKVARRVAVRAAKKRSAHVSRETVLDHDPVGPPTASNADWKPVLDAEVARLPERFRLPVLLCYLQDYSTDGAARVLGIPRGTVLSRLATARTRLAERLTRHGLALPATLVSSTVVSTQLVSATARSAAAFAVGEAVLSSAPTLLATEVIRMTAWKLPAAVAAAMVLTVGVGSGVAWVQDGSGRGVTNAGEATPAPQKQEIAKQAGTKPNPLTEEEKRRNEIEDLIRASTKEQIDSLNSYLADREKDRMKLQREFVDKAKQRREIAPEETPTLQRLAAAQADGVNDLRREIGREEWGISERKLRLLWLEENAAQDLRRFGHEVKLDPNSKDGIRLGVMYRRQAEVESKIRELTVEAGMKTPNAETKVQNAKQELEVLLVDMEKLEKQAHDKQAELLQTKLLLDIEARKREVGVEIRIAAASIDRKRQLLAAEEKKHLELTKVGLQAATLDMEMSLIKENIGKIDMDLRDQRDKRTRLEEAKLSIGQRRPEVTLEQIARELAELRRDVAELKRK